MVAKILPLPEAVRSQLRSGVTITSVAQCIEELVLNSLDAGATCVAVRVDLSIFRIQVVDNGEGVPKTDLKYLGRRHATSKCNSLKDLSNHLSHYGFRGEALASTINLSAVVDITTHPQGSSETFTKIFTYGKEKSVDVSKTNRPSIGTTVTIQDFMYNMPVRRKLIREAIDLESIRIRLESFALIHPKVAFSLRNDQNGNMIIQTKKSSGILATFMHLFGEERAQGLAEVYHSVRQFTVSGYIGTQPHLTKTLQFVYVNKRVILRTKIHRMVNDLLARSSIISSRLHPSSVGPIKNPSSPPKGMKLYGVFVLNIECPYSEYDICLDPSKTLVEFKEWDQLLLCIEELILKFACEENLGISLDERYKRSGKEWEEGEEEEEEIGLSQQSQSCLQLFSLKRSLDDGEVSGSSKEKYGRTLNTQDNLLAIHSVMVKRVRKEINESEGPFGKENSTIDPDNNKKATEECNKDKKCGTDVPKKADGSPFGTLKNKAKSCCETSSDDESKASKTPKTLSGDIEDNSSQCVEDILEKTEKTPVEEVDIHNFSPEVFMRKNDILNGENVIESSESDTVVSLAAKKEGVRSVLKEFKKALEDANEKDNYTECDTDLALALTEKSTQQECKDKERVQQNDNILSTLGEFMDFHNREQEKSLQNEFHTPEEDVISTPTSPPPLKSFHASSPSPAKNGVLTLKVLTERIEQSPPIFKSKRESYLKKKKRPSDLGYDEIAEKRDIETLKSEHRSEKQMSLRKSLCEKLKIHQSTSKTILSLHEKHGFSMTDTSQSKVENHSSPSNIPIRCRSSSSDGNSSAVAPLTSSKLNMHTSKHEGEGRRMDYEIGSNASGSAVCLKVNKHTDVREDDSRVGININGSILEPKDFSHFNMHTGKTEDRSDGKHPDTSFRFKPVITRTSQEVDTCSSYVQCCKKTVDVDLDLDNHGVVSAHCRSGDEKKQNSGVSIPLVHGSIRNIAGDDGEGDTVTLHSQYVTAFSQLTTPPRKSSALLLIADSYASTPEHCECSPQKPNPPLKVPTFPSFKNSMTSPQHISLRNHKREEVNSNLTSTSWNFAHDYAAHESGSINREEGRLSDTGMEGAAPWLLSEPMISNASFQGNDSQSKFHCRRDYSEDMFIACERLYSNDSVEKEYNFKDPENTSDLQISSGCVPNTQSFEVKDSVTQQRPKSKEQVEKDDKYLHKTAHHLSTSEGFTPPKVSRLGVHTQNVCVDESFVFDCSVQAQVAQNVEVINNNVEPKEMTKEKSEKQEPDSIMLIPLTQINQEEKYAENAMNLPSQVIMENDQENCNVGQKPRMCGKVTLQTQSQALSQGVVHNAREVAKSVEVLNDIVEPKEFVREKCEKQEPDSIILIPLTQTKEEEKYLENILSLPSQVVMENGPVNCNVGQKPSVCGKGTLQTQSQVLSQRVVHSDETEGNGKVTSGPNLMPADWASSNPLSESLHFSQLTLPDYGDTEPSHDTSPGFDTLPAILSDSLSVSSSKSGDLGSEGKVMSLCDINFESNQIKNRNVSCKGSVDEIKCIYSNAVTMPLIAEAVNDAKDFEKIVLEPTLKPPLGLPSLTQPIDIIPRNLENSCYFKDKPSFKTSNSCEVNSNTENSTTETCGLYKNFSLREKSLCKDDSEQEMQKPNHKCKWREAVDKDGRAVFVNLQTGNSSYEPPEMKDLPEWTSSQPLGARLHRVPLTHEPWYIPKGKVQRERESFTLTHGFKEFMSWKKTSGMRKRENAKQGVSNEDSNLARDGRTKSTALSISQEIQDAIETLLEDCEAADDSVKWTDKPVACLHEPVQTLDVAQICQMWVPPDFAMDAEVLNSGPDAGAATRSVAGVKVYNMVHPYKFSRDMLLSCKVMGQLDQKFIACNFKYFSPEEPQGKASQLVVLFDQHAVHERVRLETTIQENFETLPSGESVLCSAAVNPPLELDLPEDEVRLMQAYSKEFNQRGLYFTKTSPSRVTFQLIPSCLVAREANESRHRRCQTAGAIVESIVRDLCHTLHQTGGVLGVIPRPIIHVFNNNACRGAIKFGDELTREQCQDLIASLYSCQLPFQCAHGRPSIVPLVNLTHLASSPQKVNKPNLRRLREAMEAGTAL